MALFADTFSYQLKQNSYLIDKGTNAVSSVVTTDLLGVPRPQGNFYDIGAYEYVTPAAPPPPLIAININEVKVFEIYPTTVSNILNINLPEITTKSELLIYDMLGHLYLRQLMEQTSNQQNINVDIGQFHQGFYVCTLKNGRQTQSLKFIKN